MGRIIQYIELALGGIILSGGLATAAVYASRQEFFGVLTGFTLFIIGYELSQYSVYTTDESSTLHRFIEDMVESSGLIDLLLAVIGTGMIAYGLTLLFRSTQETNLLLAVFSTIMMFSGYVLAHLGINKTVV